MEFPGSRTTKQLVDRNLSSPQTATMNIVDSRAGSDPVVLTILRILEERLRNHRRLVWGAWVAGMALAAVWPIWTALRPRGAPVTPGAPPGSTFLALELPAMEVGARPSYMSP
jgi:hypothetical protein